MAATESYSSYTYFMWTVPGISHLLKTLDDAIVTLIKALLKGYTSNLTEHVLFPLPVKYGGMGLIIPSKFCQEEYENSWAITKETTNKVMRNEIQFLDNRVSTAKIKKWHQKSKEKAERCNWQNCKK